MQSTASTKVLRGRVGGGKWISFTENGYRLGDITETCRKQVTYETIYGDIECYHLDDGYVLILLPYRKELEMYFYKYVSDGIKEVDLNDKGLKTQLNDCKLYSKLCR